MARPSKLTESQVQEIEFRMANGESASSLAREFGVSEGAIRKRVSTNVKKIKEVANQIVAAETALNSLPVSTRVSTRSLADKLLAISGHLASAAEYGASTAHRLSAIANSQLDKMDDANPMGDIELIKGISGLTKMANDASEIPLNLLKAAKDGVGVTEEDPAMQPVLIELVGRIDESEDTVTT